MEPIGSHTYKLLKSLSPSDLTEEDKRAMEEYQNRNNMSRTDEQVEFSKAYSKKVFDLSMQEGVKVERDILWNYFNQFYKMQNGRDYDVSDGRLQNVLTVILYFCQDQEFFECQNLSKITEPSFDKGLLLIGGNGNGKSSVMKAVKHALNMFGRGFKIKNMVEVVSEYGVLDQEDKSTFWHQLVNGDVCFDDIKSEGEANNYGKRNMFKDIFEARYLKTEIKTHGTCNYDEKYPFDLQKAVDEFLTKYGMRVHDRLFEKFNVIEFKGKSMRR